MCTIVQRMTTIEVRVLATSNFELLNALNFCMWLDKSDFYGHKTFKTT